MLLLLQVLAGWRYLDTPLIGVSYYVTLFLGHSSQYHRRLVPRVLRFSSNFHHYFISMNGANPENFSFKTFPYQFLLVFKNFKVSMNSWHFMKLGFRAKKFKLLMGCSSLFVDMLKVPHE